MVRYDKYIEKGKRSIDLPNLDKKNWNHIFIYAILYIKEKNIDNIKNIKLETLVVNKEIEDMEKISKIIENTKNVIINLDFNKIEKQNKFISYGYNSKSDITISSIDEDEALIYIQKEITSIFGRKIEPQEVKVKLKSDINIYNIMIIIALNVLYTR